MHQDQWDRCTGPSDLAPQDQRGDVDGRLRAAGRAFPTAWLAGSAAADCCWLRGTLLVAWRKMLQQGIQVHAGEAGMHLNHEA